MFKHVRSVSLLIALLGAGLMTGCATTSKSASEGQSSQAIACDKCETTWISSSTGTGTHGQVTAIQKRKMMECPECRNEATRVLQSGKSLQPGQVVHKCESCGSNMSACEVH